MGVKINILARDGANKHQCQCKDNQKYSIITISMDCPRTMTIWNYFPGGRARTKIGDADTSPTYL